MGNRDTQADTHSNSGQILQGVKSITFHQVLKLLPSTSYSALTFRTQNRCRMLDHDELVLTLPAETHQVREMCLHHTDFLPSVN